MITRSSCLLFLRKCTSEVHCCRMLDSAASVPVKSKRVRNTSQGLPEKLLNSIEGVLGEMHHTKRGLLKAQLRNNSAHTLYTKPRPPRDEELSRGTTNNFRDYEAMEELNQEHNELTLKASNEKLISNADFLMLRSMPTLYYLADRMFTEIRAFDPSFAPFNVLDMGHNLGASVWAANAHFAPSVEDYIIHEHQKAEYDRTLRLLNAKYTPHIPNVHVKGPTGLPRLRTKSYDLVTAINYLPYLQPNQIRSYVKMLWDMTDRYLVIADIANVFTSLQMNKVRDEFVRLQKYNSDGYVLGPCPHMGRCPLAASADPQGCRFTLPRLHIPDREIAKYENEKAVAKSYSYLILAKGVQYRDQAYSRVLGPVKHLTNPNRNMVTTCNTDGGLYKAEVHPSSAKQLYNHTRFKKSGDLLDEKWTTHAVKFLPVPYRTTNVQEHIRTLTRHNRKRKEEKLQQNLEELSLPGGNLNEFTDYYDYSTTTFDVEEGNFDHLDALRSDK